MSKQIASDIWWGWLFNGKPSPDHIYKTPEEAMEYWRYKADSSIEELAERSITLARVRVTVEVVSEMLPPEGQPVCRLTHGEAATVEAMLAMGNSLRGLAG